MEILDQGGDTNGQRLAQLLRNFEPPTFVKEADFPSIVDCRQLPNHLYADPAHRRFPCDTPAATWVSAAFFLNQRDQLPPKVAAWTEQRLDEFAAGHKIGHTIDQLRSKVADFRRPPDDSQLPDDVFALVERDETGRVIRRAYPIQNAYAVKMAAQYLVDYRDHLPYPVRRQMAQKTLEKAATYGAAISEHVEFLEKQAGHGACSADEAAELLFHRAQAIGHGGGHKDVQKQLVKLAKTCLEKPQQLHDPEMRIKLAELVDQYDHAFGLAGKYTELLPAPEDALFRVTRIGAAKLASELCESPAGAVYPTEAFSDLSLCDLAANMGDEFAAAITKDGLHVDPEQMAQIVRTLPRPDAAQLDQYLKLAGLAPEFDRGAAQGIDEAEWATLAGT